MSKATSVKIWNVLRSRAEGSTFSSRSLYNLYPNEKKGISSILGKMVGFGVIEAIGVDGKMKTYRIKEGFHKWGESRNWKNQYVKKTVQKAENGHAQAVKNGNVLNDLLEAMAAAEPEIRRLAEIERKLKEML